MSNMNKMIRVLAMTGVLFILGFLIVIVFGNG